MREEERDVEGRSRKVVVGLLSQIIKAAVALPAIAGRGDSKMGTMAKNVTDELCAVLPLAQRDGELRERWRENESIADIAIAFDVKPNHVRSRAIRIGLMSRLGYVAIST